MLQHTWPQLHLGMNMSVQLYLNDTLKNSIEFSALQCRITPLTHQVRGQLRHCQQVVIPERALPVLLGSSTSAHWGSGHAHRARHFGDLVYNPSANKAGRGGGVIM